MDEPCTAPGSRSPPPDGPPRPTSPGGPFRFVGRDRELGLLHRASSDAAAGRVRVVVIEGEPGIGKTRLATEAIELAVAAGFTAAKGRCREDEGAPPYWPWIQVFRSLLEGGRTASSDRVGPGAEAAEAAVASVPELADRLFGASDARRPPAELERPDARFRRFEAIAEDLGRRSAQQPLALLLDDIGWADPGSLLLLQFVVAHCVDSRLLLVATCRGGASPRAERVSATLAALAAYDHVWRLCLPGLSEAEVATMMADALGPQAPLGLARDVRAQTGGNALFVTEAIRWIAREGGAAAAGPDWAAHLIAHGRVEEAIEARIVRLSDECRLVLGIAALIGERFRLQPLARLAGLTPERVLERLAEAEAFGIVVARSHQLGRWAYAHGLMRTALAKRFTTAERRRWHERIGEALEALHGAEAERYASELAHHFVQAAPGACVDRALRYSMLAAKQATARFADEDAAVHYRHALELLELSDEPDPLRRGEVLARLGEAAARSGDAATAEECLGTAIEIARRLEAPEHLARATLASARADDFHRSQQIISLLEEALAGLPADTPLRARVLSRLARALHSVGQPARSAEVAREAIEVAQLTGPSGALSMALYAASYFDWEPAGRARRAATAHRLIELAERERQPEAGFTGHWSLLTGFLSVGDIAAVDREVAACARLAEEIRQPFYRKYVAIFRGLRATIRGDFATAVEEARRASEIGSGEDDTVFAVSSLLGTVGRLQGDRARLSEQLERFEELGEAIPAVATGIAANLLELGRPSEARAVLAAVAADRFSALPRDFTWLASMETLAHVCCALGDRENAAVLFDLLEPYGETVVVGGPAIVWGKAIAYSLGRLATVLGRHDEADRHFASALRVHEAMGAAPYVALTQYAFAELLCDRGGPADRAAARRRFAEAVRLAEELGMPRLHREASERLAAIDGGTIGGAAGLHPEEAAERTSPPRTTAPRYKFHREGEYWTIVFEGRTVRVRDRKGLQHLARLIAEPARGFHVLDLLGVTWRSGSGGPLLDPRARQDYRRRLREIDRQAAEAESHNDPGEIARADAERAALLEELARASGLNGRDRGETSDAERARLVVTKRIKSTIQLLRTLDPELARHLAQHVHTGYVCVYGSPGEASPPWEL